MDEVISKRMAIETFKDCAENGVGIDGIVDALESLLPAQPEIIRCKDCKYGILDYDFPHERYCDFKGNDWNNDDHFCGHAKRRQND